MLKRTFLAKQKVLFFARLLPSPTPNTTGFKNQFLNKQITWNFFLPWSYPLTLPECMGDITAPAKIEHNLQALSCTRRRQGSIDITCTSRKCWRQELRQFDFFSWRSVCLQMAFKIHLYWGQWACKKIRPSVWHDRSTLRWVGTLKVPSWTGTDPGEFSLAKISPLDRLSFKPDFQLTAILEKDVTLIRLKKLNSTDRGTISWTEK